MGLKDAVRMVELGGRTEQRRRCSLFNWQIRLLQTLSGGVTSRDKFAAHSRSPPTRGWPGRVGEHHGARY